MFRRNRVPPDNYPDDFDTKAYHNYRESFRPGLWLWVREHSSRAGFGMVVVGLIGVSFVASLLILPPSQRFVVVTAPPTATPVGDITGDFPAGVIQQSITLPTRIESSLVPGEKKGYRFFVSPGITWIITVTPEGSFDPLVSLFNPDGTIYTLNDDADGSTLASQIIFEATTTGQYGLLIESAAGGATSGRYVLGILPQR